MKASHGNNEHISPVMVDVVHVGVHCLLG